jgi:hypothetical protein
MNNSYKYKRDRIYIKEQNRIEQKIPGLLGNTAVLNEMVKTKTLILVLRIEPGRTVYTVNKQH